MSISHSLIGQSRLPQPLLICPTTTRNTMGNTNTNTQEKVKRVPFSMPAMLQAQYNMMVKYSIYTSKKKSQTSLSLVQYSLHPPTHSYVGQASVSSTYLAFPECLKQLIYTSCVSHNSVHAQAKIVHYFEI